MTYQTAYAELWDQCDGSTRAAGVAWYPSAMTEIEDGAATGDRARLAAVAAHLSPRISWDQCIRATHVLASGGDRPGFIMTGPWSRATLAWVSDDPLNTFSKGATKTAPFARALAGDLSAAVIDTHMIHAGMGYRPGYGALSTAEYRRRFKDALSALTGLSEELGVPVAPLQASLWLKWKENKANLEVTHG